MCISLPSSLNHVRRVPRLWILPVAAVYNEPCPDRVRRRRAVYDGGQVDGNGLPRFGSLSSTLFGEEIFRSRKSTNKLVVHRSILSRQVRHVLDHTIKVVVAGRIKVASEPGKRFRNNFRGIP